MEFLGKYLEALGKKYHLRRMNGHFTGHGPENITLYSEDIADIGLLEISIGFSA